MLMNVCTLMIVRSPKSDSISSLSRPLLLMKRVQHEAFDD